MPKPDFSQYSLALVHEDKVVFALSGPGIRPLVQCILDNQGKLSDCTLYDKVVGLAAARLAVWSGMISQIHAGLLSETAKTYLDSIGFPHTEDRLVPVILDRTQLGICPMEMIARENPTDAIMWQKIREKLNM
jgi:hypothetical protein